MLFHNNSLPLLKYLIRPDLKIYWFAVTRICFSEYTRPVRKNYFYHFKMENIALILICNNIFVTCVMKYMIYFQEWTSKKIFDPRVSCRPGRMTANQHIFESGLGLALYLKTYFNEMYENDHSRYVQYSDIICYITI